MYYILVMHLKQSYSILICYGLIYYNYHQLILL